MGLFDTVKLKANALAADAGRAGKVSAAQARTVVLQNDIRKAERELGHSAFSLIESGAIAHPDLEAATARLRDARQALADKETEIEALRGRMPESDDVATATPTDDAPAAAPADAEAEMPEQTAAAPIAEEPPAAASVAKKPATKKPATKKAAAAKPAVAKKPAAKKPATKKARAATKPPAAKTAPAKDA
jgi:hypothetical protein